MKYLSIASVDLVPIQVRLEMSELVTGPNILDEALSQTHRLLLNTFPNS